MDAKQLKEMLSYIPESAKIYSIADHGQQSEKADGIGVTNYSSLDYYGEDTEWIEATIKSLEKGYIEWYNDEGDLERFYVNEITAVLIG